MRDVALRAFGNRGRGGGAYSRSGSTIGAVSGGQSGSSSSVRYGYAVADSADGWVDVQLDTGQTNGGDSTVQCVCDSPISQGQRVAVDVMPNGQLKARPIGQNILDEAISDTADKIQEAGQQILDDVNAEMDEWKQDHQLTDADINHSIQTAVDGATETWEGQLSSVENNIETNYATKTEVTQGIDGLRTEVSETYATSTGVTNEINSAIEQASDEISSTVEQSVMDEVGNTYATKTELTQTSSQLQLNITAATNAANSAQSTANDAAQAASSAQSDATSAKSDAEDALDKANEVSAYFKADVTGLEIGQQGEPSSVKMNSAGAFQTLEDGEVVSQFAKDKIDLGINSDASEVTMMGGTFHILAVSDGTAYGSKSLYLKPVDYEGPTGYPTYDLISIQINANTWLRLISDSSGSTSDVSAELRAAGGIDIVSSNDAVRVTCRNGNVGISGDGIWMGTTGSIVKPGGMMGGNAVNQSLPSSNVTFDANSYYDCFTGETSTGGNSAVFYRSGDYMYIWLPQARAENVQHTPILVSGMAYAANVNNTNFAASLEVTKYSGSGSLMSQGTLSMGIQTGSSSGAFCLLTCPSALVMLGRSTYGPTVYRMRMMGRSSNGGATLQSWYMTAHLM